MLRTIIVFVMLFTSLVNLALFIAKWIDTDIDTAWKAFEDHVNNCLGKL
jgi:hypothetical protein